MQPINERQNTQSNYYDNNDKNIYDNNATAAGTSRTQWLPPIVDQTNYQTNLTFASYSGNNL